MFWGDTVRCYRPKVRSILVHGLTLTLSYVDAFLPSWSNLQIVCIILGSRCLLGCKGVFSNPAICGLLRHIWKWGLTPWYFTVAVICDCLTRLIIQTGWYRTYLCSCPSSLLGSYDDHFQMFVPITGPRAESACNRWRRNICWTNKWLCACCLRWKITSVTNQLQKKIQYI